MREPAFAAFRCGRRARSGGGSNMRRILGRVGGKRGGQEGRGKRRDGASTFGEMAAERCLEAGQQAKAFGDQIEQEGTEGTEEFEQQPLVKETRNAAWRHAKESRESARCPAYSYCVCHTGSTMRQQGPSMQLPHFAPF